MNRIWSRSWWLLAAAFLCAMPSAFAQCPTSPPTSTTACMDLTGAGNNIVMGGVYVGPYTATINGVSTPVICDDFYDDVYIGETWTADIVAGSSAASSNTRLATNYTSGAAYDGLTLTQAYDAVGYLAVQMLAQTNATAIGEYDFALWSIFDYPGAINYGTSSPYNPIIGSELTAIQTDLANAVAYATGPNLAADAVDISSFTVYSPVGQTPATSPQEFLVYTPEPASLPLLGVDLCGVGLLVLFLRRRLRTSRS